MQFTFTPAVGYYFFDDHRYIEDAAFLNFMLGLDLSPNLGLEATLGRTVSTRKGENNPRMFNRMYLVTADVIYRILLKECIRPFGMAGVGGMHLRPNGHIDVNNISGDEEAEQFNLNVGGGLIWDFSKRGALRIDGRAIYNRRQ